MPGTLRNRICTAYSMLEDRLQDGQNPVRTIPLVVIGYDNQVQHIDELVDDLDDNGVLLVPNGGHDGNLLVNSRDALLQAIYSQISTLRRDLCQIIEQNRTDLNKKTERLNQRLDRMSRSITRIGICPTVQHQRHEEVNQNDGGEAPAPARNASLSPNLRSLHLLWQDYKFGIGGRKLCKGIHCRRKRSSENCVLQTQGGLG